MGIIYKLASPSGKIYIGQTTRTFEKRFKEHCSQTENSIICQAIKKYEADKISKEVLYEGDDSELDDKEKYYIAFFNSLEPHGYNIRTGGSNGKHSEISKQRMREKKMGSANHNYGKPRSEHFKQLMREKKSGANHHFYGKHLDEQHKLNLSKAHKKDDLPMYLVRIKDRPKIHCGGYAIVNHPLLPTKYFTSKKFTDEQKLNMALEYLNSYKDEGSTTK
jgi:group I intron endonuclease